MAVGGEGSAPAACAGAATIGSAQSEPTINGMQIALFMTNLRRDAMLIPWDVDSDVIGKQADVFLTKLNADR